LSRGRYDDTISVEFKLKSIKYPDTSKEWPRTSTNVVTRSRIVWLQTKTLTVFLATCLFIASRTSIARLATKPKAQMTNRKLSTTRSAALGMRMLTPCCEVVPGNSSYVYVASSVGAGDVIGTILVVIFASGIDSIGLRGERLKPSSSPGNYKRRPSIYGLPVTAAMR